MVTAGITKNLTHSSTTCPISLAACIFIFFFNVPFTPGPREVKEMCKHHLHIWKFGPGILYLFSFFKFTTV